MCEACEDELGMVFTLPELETVWELSCYNTKQKMKHTGKKNIMSASRRENSLLSKGYEQSSTGRWGSEEEAFKEQKVAWLFLKPEHAVKNADP